MENGSGAEVKTSNSKKEDYVRKSFYEAMKKSYWVAILCGSIASAVFVLNGMPMEFLILAIPASYCIVLLTTMVFILPYCMAEKFLETAKNNNDWSEIENILERQNETVKRGYSISLYLLAVGSVLFVLYILYLEDHFIGEILWFVSTIFVWSPVYFIIWKKYLAIQKILLKKHEEESAPKNK